MTAPAPTVDALIESAWDKERGVRDRIVAATQLLYYGRFAEARFALKDLLRLPPQGQRTMMRICELLIEGDRLRLEVLPIAERIVGPAMRPGDPPDQAPRLGIIRKPGATRVVVLFEPHRHLGSMIRDRNLVERPDCHLIAIRDPSRYFFFGGIKGLGADYKQCLSGLRMLASALTKGHEFRLYCIGCSAGGFAALHYGLDLEAAGVLAFGAATTAPGPGDKAPSIAHMAALRLDLSPDLAKSYKTRLNVPKTILCYGTKHAVDARHARRMAELPGVELAPLEGHAHHNALQGARQHGMFYDLVDRLLAS